LEEREKREAKRERERKEEEIVPTYRSTLLVYSIESPFGELYRFLFTAIRK
jgi:hypothetical protein